MRSHPRSLVDWGILWTVLAGLIGVAESATPAYAHLLTPVTPVCIEQTSLSLGIPVLAIVGILTVEQGRVGYATPDANGTWDYGPMQINTIWLPVLWDRFHLSRSLLEDQGCVNVLAGAWILRHDWRGLGPQASIWQAIARYHSDTPDIAKPYAWRVYRHLRAGIHLNQLLRHING